MVDERGAGGPTKAVALPMEEERARAFARGQGQCIYSASLVYDQAKLLRIHFYIL